MGYRWAIILSPLAVALAAYAAPAAAGMGPEAAAGVARALALCVAVMWCGLAAAYFRARDERAAAIERLEAGAGRWDEERRANQVRLDLLTAEREAALILNGDLDRQVVFDRICEVAAALLPGDVRMFLRNEPGLVLVAARRGGRTLEERARRREPPADDILHAASRQTKALIATEGDRLRALVPLASDDGIAGVLEATCQLDVAEEVSRRIGAAEEFGRFIAVLLRAPDLYERAVTDALTGLASRRHFRTMLEDEFARWRRYGRPLSLIMLDVDHFKKVNDTYGHPAGDAVLRGVAAVLRACTRRGDARPFRYGGEEMGVLLPETDLEGACTLAERIRRKVEASVHEHEGRRIRVTVSVGVAQAGPAAPTPEALVEAADRALYAAKEGGRNRVVRAQSGGVLDRALV